MGKRIQGRVSAKRTKLMSMIGRRDTGPELLLRKELSKSGIRYRLYKSDLPGKPDLVFARSKLIVFCDGDFWHGRKWILSGKKRFNVRHAYWSKKIEGNIARDKRINRELRRLGWSVLRFWESDIQKNPQKVVRRIKSKLTTNTKTRI